MSCSKCHTCGLESESAVLLRAIKELLERMVVVGSDARVSVDTVPSRKVDGAAPGAVMGAKPAKRKGVK